MTEELMNILNSARKTLEKETEAYTDARKSIEKPVPKKKPTTRYDRYRYRLERGNTEKFKGQEVLYYFYDLMREFHEGKNYFVSNVAREHKQINIAIERYGIQRVLEMTEYLMTSGQTLLKIGTFSPAILSTSWGNTINVHTEEYIESVRNPKPEATLASKREWGKSASEDYKVTIGDWGDE